MKDKDKKPVDKLLEDATYQNLSAREKDLLLVYADKTIILFGTKKKNVRKKFL